MRRQGQTKIPGKGLGGEQKKVPKIKGHTFARGKVIQTKLRIKEHTARGKRQRHGFTNNIPKKHNRTIKGTLQGGETRRKRGCQEVRESGMALRVGPGLHKGRGGQKQSAWCGRGNRGRRTDFVIEVGVFWREGNEGEHRAPSYKKRKEGERTEERERGTKETRLQEK